MLSIHWASPGRLASSSDIVSSMRSSLLVTGTWFSVTWPWVLFHIESKCSLSLDRKVAQVSYDSLNTKAYHFNSWKYTLRDRHEQRLSEQFVSPLLCTPVAEQESNRSAMGLEGGVTRVLRTWHQAKLHS